MPKDYQYTGQRNETSLGIYDYKARFYSPKLGRFLSADTLVPGVGSQHLSRYMYVTGNAVRYNDPTGHAQCAEGMACDNEGPASSGRVPKLPQLKYPIKLASLPGTPYPNIMIMEPGTEPPIALAAIPKQEMCWGAFGIGLDAVEIGQKVIPGGVSERDLPAGLGIIAAYLEGLGAGTNVNPYFAPSNNPDFANMHILNQDTLVEIVDFVLPQAIHALTGIDPNGVGSVSGAVSVSYDILSALGVTSNIFSLGIGSDLKMTIIVFPPGK